MKQKLSLMDSNAVDLLLDQSARSIGFAAPVAAEIAARSGIVSRVLNLIGQMPAVDPPADLVKRTMEMISRRANQTLPMSAEGLGSELYGQNQRPA